MRPILQAIGLVSFVSLVLTASNNSNAEDWSRFRGPNGQGVSTDSKVPQTWSATEDAQENIAWKTKLTLGGWSSPIIVGDSVFLTGTKEDGVSCRVLRINRKDGSVLWDKEVHRQKTTKMRRQNSYATPTPVSDGTQVYAVFFDGTALAVDMQGSVQWKNSDFKFYSLHGLGASPLLADGMLVMPFDGSSRDNDTLGWKEPWDQAAVVAWDCSTGKVRWTGRRESSRVGHVTPILVNDGKQLISAGGDRVQGFDIATGERIWSIYSKGEGVTPSPVVGEGLIFTSSGFEEPTIRAIRIGGKGDITKSHIAWEQKRGVPALPSFLFVAPHLYSITRDNILYCFTAETGEIVWQERLQGTYSASPLLAANRIYITSEEGITTVLKPGTKYQELAKNEVNGICKASLAVADGQIIMRSSDYLYCIGE
ncbi:MAG: PQQ-binding-like beta-propeller repeat protein [Planctomycetota bacterium]